MIPSTSPSVKIQIMDGKGCLRCKGKTLLGVVNKTFKKKKFVDITQQCFAFLPQVNFPVHNLNFHWRWWWWDQIQGIFLNLFYFTFSNECLNNMKMFFMFSKWINWKPFKLRRFQFLAPKVSFTLWKSIFNILGIFWA